MYVLVTGEVKVKAGGDPITSAKLAPGDDELGEDGVRILNRPGETFGNDFSLTRVENK